MHNFEKLFEAATSVIAPRKLNKYTECGGVGGAILTEAGNIYTGICIVAPCGMGFCAEHAAIAEMLKAGESRIVEMIAVDSDKVRIMPPCGRCREFVLNVNYANRDTIVHLSAKETQPLSELLPHMWQIG